MVSVHCLNQNQLVMLKDIKLTFKAMGYFVFTTLYIVSGVVLMPFEWIHKVLGKGAHACADCDHESLITK